MTPQQKEIIYLFEGNKNKLLRKYEIVKLIGGKYYYNESKHVGDRLSTMVNAGLLVRHSTGVYRLGEGRTVKEEEDANQLKLF